MTTSLKTPELFHNIYELVCTLEISRITAYGAAGGRSVVAMSRSHGVYITGDFLLRKGELLLILVGQKGEDACPNVSPCTSLLLSETLLSEVG